MRLLLLVCFCLGLVAEETTPPAEAKTEIPAASTEVSSITQYGITWTFDKAYPSGQFVTGDYWVIGPVVVTGISNSLNEERFTAQPGQNGSMLNPAATGAQGYDNRLKNYKAALNAGLIDGKPISPEQPLNIENGSSLISMVSWLYNSPSDTEKGCPKFNGGTKAPRPVTRSAAVLTVLSEIPTADSFRPAYCGSGKTVTHKVSDLDLSCLHKLKVVDGMQATDSMLRRTQRPWIDHVHEYLGAMVHPTLNLHNYGREITNQINNVALSLHLDIPEEDKKRLAIQFVQIGIDFYGIAAVGGGWPANGGHQMGRKLPILAAGRLLNNKEMLAIGQTKIRFHDDEQTFYVEQIDIDRSNGKNWGPDSRAADKLTYQTEHLGMPEWGIRHFFKPRSDNRGWRTPYRDINNTVLPATALAASMFDLREAWNHDALFDYARRIMHEPKVSLNKINSTNAPSHFTFNMWQAYADQFVDPIEWNPVWSAALAKDPKAGKMSLKKKPKKKAPAKPADKDKEKPKPEAAATE